MTYSVFVINATAICWNPKQPFPSLQIYPYANDKTKKINVFFLSSNAKARAPWNTKQTKTMEENTTKFEALVGAACGGQLF